MQQLDKIVNLYLSMDTNYALMLTGDWGAGKTYYFKHTLDAKISETPVFKDQKKRYRPILVSLFGLKSVEEIQSEVFLCLYPILKSSKLKLSSTIGKAIIKGILNLKGLGEYDTFTEGIEEAGKNVDKKKLIKFEELVICFDDLERISPNLKIEELIGFVNSLVENENVKVLIIANKGKGALSDVTYKDFEEKTIGNTIEFIHDFNTSYDSILKNKYSAYKGYISFLEENKDFVLNVFSKKSENLRTLIFALNYFQLIYSEIYNNLFKNENLKERKTEILLNILKFTISISIEYKKGELTFKKRNDLDDTFISNLSLILPAMNQSSVYAGKDKEKEKTAREIFIENYYTGDTFIFYKSVYDYITGGTTFDYSLLLLELQTNYHIQENIIPEQYEVFNKLVYPSCYSLNNTEYLKLTRKMLNYSYSGSYDLYLYPTIFHFATRFGNPLKLNISRVEKSIISGMIKGKNNYTYDRSLEIHFSRSTDMEYKENWEQIKKAAIELNNKIQSDSKAIVALQLEELCYTNFEEFSRKILDHKQPHYCNPIFSKFNADKFYSYFNNSSPNQRWEIVCLFSNRYVHNSSSQLKPDIPFLQKLKYRIERKNNRLSGKNVTGFIYSEFEKDLQKSIESLNDAI